MVNNFKISLVPKSAINTLRQYESIPKFCENFEKKKDPANVCTK